MQVLLLLSSLVLILLSNVLLLRCLGHLHTWSQRRAVQCLVLALPLISLDISISEFCFSHMPKNWVALVSLALALLLILIAIGAFLLGMIRLVLVTRFIACYGGKNDPRLQELAKRLTPKIQTPPVRLLLCHSDQPLALTYGLFRSTVLLSTWMLEQLDSRELEAVLAHELHHVAQRDYLMIWLATILRDAFFYLPTSRQAYRSLQCEKELACDDMVVGVTRRPLALASALTKVWLSALERKQPGEFRMTQSLEGGNNALHTRIERLLHPDATSRVALTKKSSVNNSTVWMLFFLQVACFFVIIAMLGCGTTPLFPGLF